ncbi:hypothetical protein, partial [Methylobacterium symbioticum]|uniref:hypothetical protein n=1 Tax=Methylobacterium symbioticum TaxID=2584084 RepID=UPI001AEF2112
MLIVVIDDPYDRFRFNHQAYEMPVGGGIHRISSRARTPPGPWQASRMKPAYRLPRKPPR